jgi:hypothetical protein
MTLGKDSAGAADRKVKQCNKELAELSPERERAQGRGRHEPRQRVALGSESASRPTRSERSDPHPVLFFEGLTASGIRIDRNLPAACTERVIT